jgi:tetratricopeptide (TPR) repeat protein
MSSKNKENNVLQFPGIGASAAKAGYQRVKASYTLREVKELTGVDERLIRRWLKSGILRANDGDEEEIFGFHTLSQLKNVRDLRRQGVTLKALEAELRGQLTLFQQETRDVIHLLSPFEEALLLHDQGDAEGATIYYREAITRGENVADAYCNLGIIEQERGLAAKALDCFTLALNCDPRHVEAHYDLGNLYFDSKEHGLAKFHFECSTEIEPNFAPAYFNAALVYYELKDYRTSHVALKKYKTISEARGENIEALDEVLGWLEKAGRLQPG